MIDSGPQVMIIDASSDPYNLAVATARTCYSSRGIVYPEEMDATESARELRDRIALSTRKAGHLTTRQHIQFIFAISDVSRHAVWQFLHSHPHFNSEQVSQRYVEVKEDNFILPPLNSNQEKIFKNSAKYQLKVYKELSRILEKDAAEIYYQIFPARRKNVKKWYPHIERKAREVARYILPLATSTYLYHTINGLTLFRYARLRHIAEPSFEISLLLDRMLEAVQKWDQNFFNEIDDPIPLEETPEYKIFEEFGYHSRQGSGVGSQSENFDRDLGEKTSRLISYTQNGEKILAESMRLWMGNYGDQSISDEDLIAMLLDPARNPYWSDTQNPSVKSPLSRTLEQLSFTFMKKISHSADSQNQRHRQISAARPFLHRIYDGKKDFIVPKLIASNSQALGIYEEAMDEIFANIHQLLDAGTEREKALMLLPNAYPVRLMESGTLLAFHHRWKLRACYQAQEEIFHASMDEIAEVSKVMPAIGKWIKAPCWFRKEAGVKPFCPEGERYCGTRVWKLDIEDYHRII